MLGWTALQHVSLILTAKCSSATAFAARACWLRVRWLLRESRPSLERQRSGTCRVLKRLLLSWTSTLLALNTTGPQLDFQRAESVLNKNVSVATLVKRRPLILATTTSARCSHMHLLSDRARFIWGGTVRDPATRSASPRCDHIPLTLSAALP